MKKIWWAKETQLYGIFLLIFMYCKSYIHWLFIFWKNNLILIFLESYIGVKDWLNLNTWFQESFIDICLTELHYEIIHIKFFVSFFLAVDEKEEKAE